MNILVTGGTSGVGEAILKKIAVDKSHTIYFTYANSLNKANALMKRFDNTTAIHCDFTKRESVKALVNKIKDMKLHVLVNNAVSPMDKNYFHKIDANHFEEGFRSGVLPVLEITQESIKTFRKNKFGKIINIASSAIINNPPIGWSEYAANKAYLVAMSQSWATENIRYNITSNSISPSFMKTPFTADIDDRVIDEMTTKHPLKKLLTPDEVADCVVFFISSSQHVNGLNLVINAGMKAAFFLSLNLSNLLDAL